jgi:hypothetical protein
MMPFLVEVKGLTEEGKGKWVLAVDPAGDRLLLVGEDKSLHWYPMAECTFYGTFPPGTPQPVVIVEPERPAQGQAPTLLVPNRQARRHPPDNGA